ncbi:helix-turn-helix transcriptional regulator [Planomicrobium sp. CPCC 101079]|uniref:helix-turn-helix transcriptional regulator n=1 Tax=Planomicrobium sp. CPCC 101079 TaxID=2599618 RepID=UPI0011B7B714|nr:helix-turn-helix transcriptional regulator [Planomicrobium sp. CPCC 101079]TWT04901.1 helix-turn-helix transcriptional regulator [Planomicrobium sp. CPCC 101079]
MEIGSRLKYHRIKKKISLEELASGIISPKELKKIEAGIKAPSLQDLQALCKKLEISLAPKDNPIGKVLVKNFKSSLLHPQNKGKIMEQYADIHDHPLLHVDEDIELEYSIQQIRYFIITGDLDSAEEKIKEMDRFKEFMNQEQFYLFHKYNGNYNYILNDFEQALKTYLMAEKISPPSISTSELGDLYYSIGISAAQCWELTVASKYSELALKIYQQEFIPKRIVECHLNIAINERRMGNYKKAEEHFKHAVTIGNKLDVDILKFTTEYNYGYLYFNFQNYELAIHHVENAIEYLPKEYTSDLLLSYCILIKCHLELNNLENAKALLDKGHNIIKEKNLSLETPSNTGFKEVYVEFMCLSFYIEEEIANFEEYVVEKLVPLLKANNKHYEIGFYYGYLGNTYFEQGKYKEAALMFQHSKKAYKNLLMIK